MVILSIFRRDSTCLPQNTRFGVRTQFTARQRSTSPLLDERLDAPLWGYLDTGEPVNFRHGEFSIPQIQWLRQGRSYLLSGPATPDFIAPVTM